MNIAVVTGATRGIGRAIADNLANAGISVIGVARADSPGFPGTLLQADLASTEDTARLLDQLADRPIKFLVNNVGVVSKEPLLDLRLDTLQSTLDLALRSTAQMTRGLARHMIRRGAGRIVNISSFAALGELNRTSDSAAKAGIIAATRSWAVELAQDNITVNAVAPGPVDTEKFRATNPAGSLSFRQHIAKIPLGRLGRPAEIAATVAFLLSDGAAYITGQTIHADGGRSIGHLL